MTITKPPYHDSLTISPSNNPSQSWTKHTLLYTDKATNKDSRAHCQKQSLTLSVSYTQTNIHTYPHTDAK